MTWKPSTFRIRKWSRPIVAGLVTAGAVATTYAAVVALGESGDNPSLNNPQVASQDARAVTTELARTDESIRDKKTESYSEALNITTYRSPSCGCCGRWIDHLETQGFQTKDVESSNMAAVKQKYSVPDQLRSCHTAVVDGYVIEGHVPAADIKRLLTEKPNIAGIAVPGMPLGTPGMEVGDQREPFTVFSFDREGRSEVFREYPS